MKEPRMRDGRSMMGSSFLPFAGVGLALALGGILMDGVMMLWSMEREGIVGIFHVFEGMSTVEEM
jgi:hypothetical protein